MSGRDSPEGAYRSGGLRRPRPTGGLLARRAVPVPGRGAQKRVALMWFIINTLRYVVTSLMEDTSLRN